MTRINRESIHFFRLSCLHPLFFSSLLGVFREYKAEGAFRGKFPQALIVNVGCSLGIEGTLVLGVVAAHSGALRLYDALLRAATTPAGPLDSQADQHVRFCGRTY